MSPNFKGFTPQALQFLAEIKINNSKSWYEANKPSYRENLLLPFQELVSDLSDFMLTIDPHFITTPSVDKTLSRIYRDTRFSKDKSLYRDNMWLTFKRQSPDWKEAPAYYFEITPNGYRYGMGFYAATSVYMDFFRRKITENPSEFIRTVAFLQHPNPFTLEGEKYKKARGENHPPAIREWIQYKSFYFSSNHVIDATLFRSDLVGVLIEGFSLLAPLYRFLWDVKYDVDAQTGFSFSQ